MFPEGGVKKDVEDHVGRGVDHKQELADGKQDEHPGRHIMQPQIPARQKLANADRLVEVDEDPGGQFHKTIGKIRSNSQVVLS